jgi:glycosyltransferase involved in cell wall biosynthesis
MRALSRRGVPVLFRGDSHLLDGPNRGIRWWLKRAVLRRVFSWPDAFLYVGSANRAYYEAFDVDAARLWACPHAIDVGRFAEPSASYETEAAEWRSRLGIAADKAVLLFAGKFERKKCPIELMNAVRYLDDPRVVLVLVGGGELEGEVNELASRDPARFKVLPFQNQSRMPVVYRLGGIFVLPSAFGETWGLAVNEALACGRPVIVSDRVGCAADVVNETCGRVFTAGDFSGMMRFVSELSGNRRKLAELGRSAAQGAWAFDLERTETALVNCLQGVLNK